MKRALRDYVCEWEKELNVDLMNKADDRPLVEYVLDSWRSLEVIPQIKFIGYEYTEHESEIDINKHIFKRDKKKKKKDKYDVKFVNDDRVGRLTVHLEVSMMVTDPKTNETSLQVYPIKKAMLIPLQDENGYYYLKGKKYYLIYQLSEKSSYTSSQSVTIKSLMPIAVKRNPSVSYDINEKEYVLPCYYVYVLKKEVPVILFYLSRGYKYALDYLNVSQIISFLDTIPSNAQTDEDNLYFPLSSKCVLKVDKNMFDKYTYVQSIVGAFCTVCTNRVTIKQLEDEKVWIKRLANPNNYDKGKGILKFFNRLLDKNTQNILKIPEYHKTDIYAVIRWIMQNFNYLRMKDNCDLKNKRLRCNEYIASLLDVKFSKNLSRIVSMGDKATIENIKELTLNSSIIWRQIMQTV